MLLFKVKVIIIRLKLAFVKKISKKVLKSKDDFDLYI